MNIAETLSLVSQYWPETEFKPYELTEYDRKYKFKGLKTKVQIRKSEEYIAKETSKLRVKYDAEQDLRNKAIKLIQDTAMYPDEIAEMFRSSFKYAIDDLNYRHQRYLDTCEEIKNTYGDFALSCAGNIMYYFGKQYNFKQETWDYCVKQYYKCTNTGYVYPLADIKDWESYVKDVIDMHRYKKQDMLTIYGQTAYQDTIKHVSSLIIDVMDAVDRIFGGIPDECETEPNWGVGGKFNCILAKGPRRISFCSFTAGGHSVQRWHFRYKITELKSK